MNTKFSVKAWGFFFSICSVFITKMLRFHVKITFYGLEAVKTAEAREQKGTKSWATPTILSA